jgi:glycosyltransferase involved in cell wall biosynthesis
MSAPSNVAQRQTRWPGVSVVVPTRDRPDLLVQAVRTILEQHYEGPIEILVVFDQCQPRPIEVASRPNRTIRIAENARSPGLAGARNTGILAARNELVAFCDDDDEWFPDKLRTQVDLLLGRPAATAITTGVIVEFHGHATERTAPSDLVTFDMLLGSRIMELHPSTFLARRSDLVDNDGLVDEHIPGGYGEDYEWLLRRARRGPVVAVRRPLARIHWDGSSWFTGRWDTIVDALSYLLDRYPEFSGTRRGVARIHGQIAFAHAAARRPTNARRWAWRALRAYPLDRRAFAALAVSTGLVSARTILHAAHRYGRGV